MENLVTNPGLDHLAIQIFQYLDWGSLRRCYLVSNTWKNLVYLIIQKRSKNAKNIIEKFDKEELLLQLKFPEWRSVYNYFKKDEQELQWFVSLLSEYTSRIRKMGVKWTPVFYAVAIGDMEILKFLIPSPLCPTNFCLGNLCHKSVASGECLPMSGYLTPLELACVHGKLEIIEVLLDRSFYSKEILNDLTLDYPSLIFFALLSKNYLDIIQLLSRHPSCQDISRHPSCQDMPAISEFNLLFKDFDDEMKTFGIVNLIQDHFISIFGCDCFTKGNTLLHFACKHGNIQLVKDIIEHGSSDLYPLDSNGETPSDIASRYGFEEIADLIDAKMGLPDLANDS